MCLQKNSNYYIINELANNMMSKFFKIKFESRRSNLPPS